MVGARVGDEVIAVGLKDGILLGTVEGIEVGRKVGDEVNAVGLKVGNPLGTVVVEVGKPVVEVGKAV